MKIIVRCGLSIFSGILLFLACPTFYIWPLGWIGFLPLLIALFDKQGLPQTRHAFLYGFLTGFTAISGLFITKGGFSWMIPFLERFAEFPKPYSLPLSIAIFTLFVSYHALIFAFLAKLICFLRTELRISLTWILALSWATLEFCFPCIFPWYFAFTQVPFLPIIQIADLTGPVGVSFLLGLGNGAVFEAGCVLLSKDRSFSFLKTPLTALGLILLSLGYGLVRIHQIENVREQAPKLQIGLVQGNISMSDKINDNGKPPELPLQKYQKASEQLSSQGVHLIIWPETAYPAVIRQKLFTDFRTWEKTPLVFGAPSIKGMEYRRLYNSAFFLNEHGMLTGQVDKNFLLIFGEYVPFLKYMPWLRKLSPNIADNAAGIEPGMLPFEKDGKTYSLGMMICYEDILPRFGRRLFETATPPNLLINLTNDAWFGETAEPYQHLALSVFRAIEHRVDLVRATNTGVSAFIHATGEIQTKGTVYDSWGNHRADATTLIGQATLLSAGGYYQWLGDGFATLCFVTVALFGIIARHRARKPVHFTYILGSSLFLIIVICSVGLFAPGTDIKSTLVAISHYQEHRFSDEFIFRSTWLLGILLPITSFIMGMFLELLHQKRIVGYTNISPTSNARVEMLTGLIVVLVLPVHLWGRMEGNTGLVVVLVLLCSLFSLIGESCAFILQRFFQRNKKS